MDKGRGAHPKLYYVDPRLTSMALSRCTNSKYFVLQNFNCPAQLILDTDFFRLNCDRGKSEYDSVHFFTGIRLSKMQL